MQYSVMIYKGKESGKEYLRTYIYTHITESSFCTPETSAALGINQTSIKKKTEHVLGRNSWVFFWYEKSMETT